MLRVGVLKGFENICHPQLKGDVGYDLRAAETLVHDLGITWVRTGVALAFPKGVWGEIMGRSSMAFHNNLCVFHSVIDSGYTGEISVGVWGNRCCILKGDRIAQLVFRESVLPDLVPQYGEVTATARASAGFGSTGR